MKNWYLVSAGVHLEPIDGEKPKRAMAWENKYLINASSHLEARRKGLALARKETPRGVLPVLVAGRAVRLKVLGVRRTQECRQTMASKGMDKLDLGFLKLEFGSLAAARAYFNGVSRRSTVKIID